jgi:hypothetical protein
MESHGVACSLRGLVDPSASLQSTHQYPARTQSKSLDPCNQRSTHRVITRALASIQILVARDDSLLCHISALTGPAAPGHDSSGLERLASSFARLTTQAGFRQLKTCRVARSEPTTAMSAETVAAPLQHTIDALVADQPLSRFQSPGR